MAIPANQMINKLSGIEHSSKREAEKMLERYKENCELGKALGQFFFQCCLARKRKGRYRPGGSTTRHPVTRIVKS